MVESSTLQQSGGNNVGIRIRTRTHMGMVAIAASIVFFSASPIVPIRISAAPLAVPPQDLSDAPRSLADFYDHRIATAPGGEPLVAVGLMQGQQHIVIAATDGAVRIDSIEDGVQQRLQLARGERVEVRVDGAQPAQVAYDVALESFPWRARPQIEASIASWKAAGYSTVRAEQHGTLLQHADAPPLDNREVHLVLPARNARHARALVHSIHRRMGKRPVVRRRLQRAPTGRLRLQRKDAPAVVIGSGAVRLVPLEGGTVHVHQVEHGKGYAWHGREDRRYRGAIYIVVDSDGTLAAVNLVGIETILSGVVPAELFASAPPEALKAQAVAARNTLLAKLGHRHFTDPFHVCSEQHCQVYAGTRHEDARTTAAVASTRGKALFFGPRLVDAAYSSTCGGHTEDSDAVWGNTPDPALRGRPDFDAALLSASAGADALLPRRIAQRILREGIRTGWLRDWLQQRPVTYCSQAAAAHAPNAELLRWSQRMDSATLNRYVNARYPTIGRVQHLRAAERGPGGRIMRLEIIGSHDRVSVLREFPIRQLFGNLKSGAFVIDEHRDAAGQLTGVMFHGAGWGHGVGMCQMGAIGRAASGQSYEQILHHYYNGATLSRVYR